ncbi:hypothetical protein Q8A67_019806 [Cirrhinus molitorella]|uniref:Uncharacterized protein n=1 Tax=Cirrhinus molitorella TaxID=172907 RepID=A0AA88P7T6_9TELE|nr:hypothetical protein Q8A67_019806 [Cirrhinus molitorella]
MPHRLRAPMLGMEQEVIAEWETKESQWGQQLNLESFTADLNRPQRWRKKRKRRQRASEETAEAGKFSEKR